jgi:hypothetical protein
MIVPANLGPKALSYWLKGSDLSRIAGVLEEGSKDESTIEDKI